MIRHAVQSTNIKSVGYDLADHVLEIEFHSGGIYQYFGVSESIYGELMAASSYGSYFHRHIKDKYPYRKVP